MTVSSSVNKVIYSGNSATVLFPVNYYFLENSHLKVILRAADGTETVQALTTNYTVTGAGNPAGGSITMFIAPLIGTTLTILRNVPATQETVDFVFTVFCSGRNIPRIASQVIDCISLGKIPTCAAAL